MSDDPDEQRLQEAYYSPKTMGSLSKMLRMFKGSIPDSFIREWVKKQEYNQLYTPKKRVFMPVLPKDGQAQMDLMFYPWRGKLWPILWVVEVANRKAYARELRSKEAKNVTPELKSILEEANGITSIVADAGSEFINKSMKAMLEAEGVELHTVEAGVKEPVGIVERFNRTLRGLLTRYVDTVDSDWRKGLPDLLENYNTNFHSRLHGTPDELTPRDQERFAARQYIKAQPYLRLLDSFHEGDKVRVALKRKMFKKGGQVFGKALHTITDRVGYQMETDDGALHVARDLLKVGTVESREPARKAVPEATRLKKQKAKKLLKETRHARGEGNSQGNPPEDGRHGLESTEVRQASPASAGCPRRLLGHAQEKHRIRVGK